MEHLLRLMLTLSFEKVAFFLQIVNVLKDPFKQDILTSLLMTGIQEKNISDEESKDIINSLQFITSEEAQEFPLDPLMIEMINFNKEVVTTWYLLAPDGVFSEDKRLDISIRLLQTNARREKKTTENLLKKLDQLIKLYASHGYGYAENTMTSLYSAVMIAEEETKTTPDENNPAEEILISKVVAELQKKFQTQTEEMYAKKLKAMTARYDLCLSMCEHKIEKIDLLCTLDYEFKLFRMTLEAFIQSKMREHKTEFSGSHVGNPYLKMFADLKDEEKQDAATKKIMALYEIVMLLQSCLYAKGKNSIERLELFRKTYHEKYDFLKEEIGKENIDNTTKIFLENMQGILNANKQHFLLPSPPVSGWRSRLFGQVTPCYLPNRKETEEVEIPEVKGGGVKM